MADYGKVGGELSRNYNYIEAHPNLVRVEEPAVSLRFIALATDPAIRISIGKASEVLNIKSNSEEGSKEPTKNYPGLSGRRTYQQSISRFRE